MTTPYFEPHTAIANLYGYAMYAHEGKPWIVHTYKVRVSDGKGGKIPEQRVEHLTLDGEDAWGSTTTAGVVRAELKRQWREWVEWNDAMKGK